MSKKLTATFVLFALSLGLVSGCKEKTFSQDNNSNVSIVKNLNKGDYQSVIRELEEKNNNISSKEKYFLASAYAIKAGADIHAMYPIMEVLLFHRKAIDWDSLKSQKNPYVKFLRQAKRVDGTEEEKEVAWEKFKGDYKEYSNYKIQEINCEEIVSSENKQVLDYCKLRFEQYKFLEKQYFDKLAFKDDESDDLPWLFDETDTMNFYMDHGSENLATKLKILSEETFERTQDIFKGYKLDKYPTYIASEEDINSDDEFDYEEGSQISNDVFTIEHSILDYSEETFELKKKKALFFTNGIPAGKAESVKALNFIWSLYESIPLIQRLPKITIDQQEDLTVAFDLLANLAEDTKYTRKSLEMMTLLMGFSFSSILADSSRLERVTQPMDFPCHMKHEKLVEYHPIIHDRMTFLTKIAKKSGTLKKEELEVLDGMQSQATNFNRIMDESAKVEFFENFLGNKVLNCDPNSYL